MKRYIGSVSEYTGQIRMLDTNNIICPHVLGGANDKEGETHEFVSYEESQVNLVNLEKNGLRFLTEDEVKHFLAGENIYGEKVAKPEAPEFTKEQKLEMAEFFERYLEEFNVDEEEREMLLKKIKRLREE